MKLKFLIPSVLALSTLAVPAFAQGYYSYEAPINGAQLTDMPSQRGNVTRTGSFLRPEYGYAHRHDYWARRYYRDYDRDYYYRGW